MGKEVIMQTRIMFLMCLLVCLMSCKTDSRNAPAIGTQLTEQQISRLRPGMTVNTVIQICGEAIPTSIGALWYPSNDGQTYVCYFLGTREVPRPRGKKHRLVAVVKVPEGEHAYSTNAVYVIPEHVKSQRFTGIIFNGPQ